MGVDDFRVEATHYGIFLCERCAAAVKYSFCSGLIVCKHVVMHTGDVLMYARRRYSHPC